MNAALEALVWRRAENRCEYCGLAQGQSSVPFEIDHVIALKHRGRTVPENLALSCFFCNSAKGSNIAGLDPLTGQLCPLFNPRVDVWPEHFAWNGVVLEGRTPIGRTTIAVLAINQAELVAVRQLLALEAAQPPPA